MLLIVEVEAVLDQCPAGAQIFCDGRFPPPLTGTRQGSNSRVEAGPFS
jgi:hypothetical protein